MTPTSATELHPDWFNSNLESTSSIITFVLCAVDTSFCDKDFSAISFSKKDNKENINKQN